MSSTPESREVQKQAFLGGEGDAYFARNNEVLADPIPATWAAHLAPFVGAGTNVLEIGCAAGENLACLRSLRSIEGWGCDPSAAAIHAGRERWPYLHLAVGSADAVPFERKFDTVICGFFLCWVDRALLPRVVAEVDRLVEDRGTLVIADFSPAQPSVRRYKHKDGLFTFKMAYERLFLSFPQYQLTATLDLDYNGELRRDDDADKRCSIAILGKDLSAGYILEEDS